MSLRWSSYVAPKSPKGAQKRKMAVFPLKSHIPLVDQMHGYYRAAFNVSRKPPPQSGSKKQNGRFPSEIAFLYMLLVVSVSGE